MSQKYVRKFEQEKKSLYKSISKSICVDTYYIKLLSTSTKFSSLHHKKAVVLQV